MCDKKSSSIKDTHIQYIKSDEIYCENGRKSGYLMIENGRFSVIKQSVEKQCPITDYTGCRIIPGIFDTHNHGAMGFCVKHNYQVENYKQELKGYVRALPALGVTSVFPTSMDRYGICEIAQVAKEIEENFLKQTRISSINSDSEQEEIELQSADMTSAVSNKESFHPTEKYFLGTRILGIHSEGPYLTRVGEKGKAQTPPKPDLEDVKKMLHQGDGKLKLFALAPEMPGIEPIISYLLQQGVTVSLAHSNGDSALAKWAIEKGVRVATHLGNVMTGIHHRDIGVLGVSLLDERMNCELICDGIHICNDMLELMLRLKGKDKIMMISDGTPYGGAPEGFYHGYEQNSVLQVTKSGGLIDENGRICGSTKSVLDGIQNLVENLKIPLEQVLPMASLNPCRQYGFDKDFGSIREGKFADFVVIDSHFQVIATYINGQKVYEKGMWNERYHKAFLTRNFIKAQS